MSDAYEEAKEFRNECKAAAKALKQLPKEVQKEFKKQAKNEISVPLAEAMRRNAPAPFAKGVRLAIKPSGGAVPGIRLGSGKKNVLSHGATGMNLIPGIEWGGGTKKSTVTRKTKTGETTYSRQIKKMFRKHHHPFVYETIADRREEMTEAFVNMVDDYLRREGLDNG